MVGKEAVDQTAHQAIALGGNCQDTIYIPLRKGVFKAFLNWVRSPLQKQIVAAMNQHQAEASMPREDTDAPHMHQP